MRALKHFYSLMEVAWKDKVDVVMLFLWVLFIVYMYLYADGFEFGRITESEKILKVLNNGWAGTSFFALYGFASVLRIAWFKIKVKELQDAQSPD